MFASNYPNLSELTVLDVGGTSKIWMLLKKYYGLEPRQLTILNSNSVHLSINSSYTSSEHNYETVVGDGCNLPFANQSFDLIFSNSVIEHVGGKDNKEKFARECQRVGKNIYIQTPNRWFPIEPHILTFFIHWLPRSLYRKLYFLSFVYIYQIYLLLFKGSSGYVNARYWLDDANLLSYKEEIFLNRKICSVKFLGLSKSFVVI